MNHAAETREFSADEQDALGEIVNIAMGRAGARLAQVLDCFVTLAVPQVRVVDVTAVRHIVRELVGDDAEIIAVRQAFYSNPRGEAIAVYDRRGCRPLAELMGYGDADEGFIEQEVLLDVSNVLIGACLGGIAEQLGTELSYSAPSIMLEGPSNGCILELEDVEWTHALLLEIRFALEARGVTCHLFILTPDDALDNIRRELHRILSAL